MADLRIVGVSNNQLELQAPDGSRHYLPINEDLVKAIRSRQMELPESVSARDIQQMIRLGASVDDVVAKTGADIEFVSRFAKPIIAERNHIVSLARNIRLAMALDRFAEQTPVEFGNVIDERLSLNGARNITWSAAKTLEGDWLVSVDFEISANPQNATWSFDPKKLFLSPENETALQLSNNIPLSVAQQVIPRIEPIQENPEPISTLRAVPETEEPIAQDDEVVEIVEDLFEEQTTATITAIHPIVEEPVVEEHPSTSSIEEISSITEVTEEVIEPAKPQTNSRWAEVLFGSSEEEEESETDPDQRNS
jgi:hypothetical protein